MIDTAKLRQNVLDAGPTMVVSQATMLQVVDELERSRARPRPGSRGRGRRTA